MSSQLVPKTTKTNVVTLNDLERLNSPYGRIISRNLVALWADYVKVVQDTRILSAAEMLAKECSF